MNGWEDGPAERAVSPVVGVALLIAITVILAAVIGTVVLGIGVGGADAPQATLSFEVVNEEIVLIHEGGEPLRVDEIVVRDQDGTERAGLGADLTTGQREVIVTDSTAVDRINVVWEDPRSDAARILATFSP